jgi:hypothetical protein
LHLLGHFFRPVIRQKENVFFLHHFITLLELQ